MTDFQTGDAIPGAPGAGLVPATLDMIRMDDLVRCGSPDGPLARVGDVTISTAYVSPVLPTGQVDTGSEMQEWLLAALWISPRDPGEALADPDPGAAAAAAAALERDLNEMDHHERMLIHFSGHALQGLLSGIAFDPMPADRDARTAAISKICGTAAEIGEEMAGLMAERIAAYDEPTGGPAGHFDDVGVAG